MAFPLESLTLYDPHVSDIPTYDNGEVLISLYDYHTKIILEKTEPGASSTHALAFWLRSGACARLVSATESLPNGYCFLIKETVRPASLQAAYFDRSLIEARKRHPDACERQLKEAASKYTAPPNVAGHPTGGAIDITLATAEGQELDLGCAYDDDEIKSGGKCLSRAENISGEAKQHRAIMFGALFQAGFVNYPFEWWHWSYGDKYWAFMAGRPFAIYDVALE